MGIGNHSALYTSSNNMIYDPSGGYGMENGGEVVDAPNVDDFVRYHEKQGDKVQVQCKDTTPEQEKAIEEQVIMRPTAGGPTCALNVSSALADSGVFNGVDSGTWLPGNLSRDFGDASINQ